MTATKIENKIGLRIVQNGDIQLRKVFVPDEDRLPGVNSFQDTNKVRLMRVFTANDCTLHCSYSCIFLG